MAMVTFYRLKQTGQAKTNARKRRRRKPNKNDENKPRRRRMVKLDLAMMKAKSPATKKTRKRQT